MGTYVNDEVYKEMENIWKLWHEGKLEYRRHIGEWLEVGDLLGSKLKKQYLWRCSTCGMVQTTRTEYCPRCGAQMKEAEE